MKLRHLFLFVILLVLYGCGAADQDKTGEGEKKEKVRLTVSAAASLQETLDEIAAVFEKEHADIDVSYNFGSSGALQQQISQGAPVDLFFSAAQDKFRTLADEGLIEISTELAGNELVLVVPKGSGKGINSFQDLGKAGRLALGTPASVPAGQYAKESLKSQGIWEAVKQKVVYGKDVRQVLTYVESNNVDAGVVYKTDALSSSKVEIAASAPENSHTPIIYPAGIVKGTKHGKEAELFYEFLEGKKAMDIMVKHGFKIAEQ
ncbi:molybdate ABC transporter substrate-binding protein [Peribacillus sp. SCS-37]|uniref:molybdate ABC transporter substrate-binding protein n=1 Tax=Paraperibacillus esterisolvens TaxID=3115296 RepID=UPI003905BCE3